ncbi:MAG: hypothetical protein H0T84_05840 [Tatlockia sp.]|nr:hypothetical protein [Tatlockia sp.]
MKTESGKADLYKIFDSSETELGYYRPRVISFLLQYIDSHFFLFMTKVYPKWGGRLIGYYFSIFMIILSSFYLVKTLIPAQNFAFRLLLAIPPLTWINTQGTILVSLRSAKLLCIAAIIYMFTLLIKSEKWSFDFLHYRALFFHSILFTLFCLVDEQIISFLVLFTAYSIFMYFCDKKDLRSFVFYGGLSLIIYTLLFHTLLKTIFSHFTPNFKPTHLHTLSLLLKNFSWSFVLKSIQLYTIVVVKNFSFLLVFFLLAFINALRVKKYNDLLLVVVFISGSMISIAGISLIHPPITSFPDLKVSMYFLPVVTVFYCLLLYLLKDSNFTNKYQFLLAFTIVLVSLSNLSKFSEVYHALKTGHLAVFIPVSDVLTESITGQANHDETIKALNTGVYSYLRIHRFLGKAST